MGHRRFQCGSVGVHVSIDRRDSSTEQSSRVPTFHSRSLGMMDWFQGVFKYYSLFSSLEYNIDLERLWLAQIAIFSVTGGP